MKARVACLAAVMAAIPFGHLLNLGYSPMDLEPWVLALVMALIGVILGALTVYNRAFGPVYALAVYWFADVYIYDKGVLLALPLFAFIFALALAFRRIEDWALPGSAVFAVMFSFSAILQGSPQTLKWTGAAEVISVAPGRPALVHLVLDELMSPLAAPATLPPDHPAAQMLDELASKGFAVFSRARSVSFSTQKSLGAVVGRTESRYKFVKNPTGSAYTYSSTAPVLFDQLEALGYGVTIIQTNFLDLCLGSLTIRCGTYTRADNMGVFTRHGLGLGTRLKLASLALHLDYVRNKSRHRVVLYDMLSWLITGGELNHGYFSRPLVVLELLDALRDGRFTPAAGQALFAHLLLPHFPYILTSECKLKSVKDWTYPARKSDHVQMDEIYRGYWDQVACVLDRVYAFVDSTSGRDDLLVVMHGDHGSRISKNTVDETSADLRLSILAVRGHGFTPGLNNTEVGLQSSLNSLYTGFIGR